MEQRHPQTVKVIHVSKLPLTSDNHKVPSLLGMDVLQHYTISFPDNRVLLEKEVYVCRQVVATQASNPTAGDVIFANLLKNSLIRDLEVLITTTATTAWHSTATTAWHCRHMTAVVVSVTTTMGAHILRSYYCTCRNEC
jgi:hypothetical protein